MQLQPYGAVQDAPLSSVQRMLATCAYVTVAPHSLQGGNGHKLLFLERPQKDLSHSRSPSCVFYLPHGDV